MQHLIPAVMAIVLTSAITAMTINYIPITSGLSVDLREQIEIAFDTFEQANDLYAKDHIVYAWVEDCPPSTPSGDPSCVYDRTISDNGNVDPAVWETELKPTYMFDPSLPIGHSYDMGSDANGLFVCVESNYESVTIRALSAMINNMSAEKFKVGSTCAPASGMDKAALLAHEGATVFSTYWISK